MALKIKAGVEIYAYGKGCKAFTSDSNLSQEILEHLKSRFPDDIEDDKSTKEQKADKALVKEVKQKADKAKASKKEEELPKEETQEDLPTQE